MKKQKKNKEKEELSQETDVTEWNISERTIRKYTSLESTEWSD